MKMLSTLITTIGLFVVSPTAKSQPADQHHKDSLEAVVQQYYQRNIKVFQANATVADIDAIFDLFTNDFTYVHPKYGGTYSRSDLYDGYVRNQKNGSYDGTIVDIKILNTIIGLNAVAVEKKFVKKDAGEGKPEMTVFEFQHGKILKITEYW